MGNIVNRSDSDEVDSINHMLWGSLAGTAIFLILVCVYYFCRPEIDRVLKDGVSSLWARADQSEEDPSRIKIIDSAPSKNNEQQIEINPAQDLEADDGGESRFEDVSSRFGKPRSEKENPLSE